MLNSILIGFGLKKDWQKISPAEVASHNTSDSLWIVAGKKVYDVTRLIDEHPGGPAALLKRGGGVADCTRDMNFHSAKGREQWDQYQIGVIDPRAPPRSVESGAQSSPTSATALRSRDTSHVSTSSPKIGDGECCCTRTTEAKGTGGPKQHCAQCNCPDR